MSMKVVDIGGVNIVVSKIRRFWYNIKSHTEFNVIVDTGGEIDSAFCDTEDEAIAKVKLIETLINK